jgi:Hemopexin/Glycosyltransferase family 87
MLEIWGRLNKSSKLWLLASAIVVFGLFQSGGDNHFQRPLRGLKIGYRQNASSGVFTRPVKAIAWALRHNYFKGTEENLYLQYANLFLGQPADMESFLEHRGQLGRYEELLVPGHNDEPLIPYVDIGVEYPPVNIPFIVAPRLLVNQPFDYYSLFAFEMGLLTFATLLAGCWIGDRLLQLSPEQSTRYLAGSTLALLALGHLFTSRLDMILNVFLVGAFATAVLKRPVTSGILLALAAGAKLFPLLMVPLFVAYFWSRGRPRDGWHFLLAWTICTAAIFVPWAVLGEERFWVMFWFHGDRPIQLESTYAGFVLLKQILLGQTSTIALFQGSVNLVTPTNAIFQPMSTLATIGVPAVTLLAYLRAVRRATSDQEAAGAFLRSIVCFLTLLIIVSKVLSPQYLIWIWPLVFLIWDRDAKWIHATALLATGFTQFVYPYFYGDLQSGGAQGILILVARNILLIVLAYLLFIGLWSDGGAQRTANIFHRWFNEKSAVPWLYSIMTLTVVFQFAGKGALIWPQVVFYDSASSLLGALAFNLSQASLGCTLPIAMTVGPMAAIPYAGLILFGLDSVTAGLVVQQTSVLLLVIALVSTLCRLGLSRFQAIPLATLLLAGGLTHDLLVQVSAFPLAVVTSLLLLNLLWSSQSGTPNTWFGPGTLLVLVLGLTEPTVGGALLLAASLYLPVRGSATARLLGLYPIFLLVTILLISTLGGPPVVDFSALKLLPSSDIVLTITAILAGLVWSGRAYADTPPLIRLYFLSTLLSTVTAVILLGFEPCRLLEFKVSSLLLVGTAFANRKFQHKPVLGFLPVLILVILIVPNPFEGRNIPKVAATRRACFQVQGAVGETRPLQSENSFLLSMISDDPLEIQPTDGHGFSFLLPASTERPAKRLETEPVLLLNVPPKHDLSGRRSLSPRLRYRLMQTLRRSGKVRGKDFTIVGAYPPFLVLSSSQPQATNERPAYPFLPPTSDAVCRDNGGRLYVFKGKEYWRVDPFRGLPEHSYPRLMEEDWPGVPFDLEAAANGGDGYFYFFKDSHCWRWDIDGEHSEENNPIDVRSRWNDLPLALDAALEGPDGNLYFFKENQLWVWSVQQKALQGTSPQPLPSQGHSVQAAASGLNPFHSILWKSE